MVASSLKARDPKTPKADKKMACNFKCRGVGDDQLYTSNKRGSRTS
jgi:hypothetical protein